MLNHEHSWAVHWAAVTGEPLVPIEAATLDDQYKPIRVGAVTVAAEQGLVDAFVSDGEIPAKYNIAKYVTSDFSDSVTGKWPKK